MSEQTIRALKHSYIWGIVAIGVLVFGYGVTPWDAILTLIAKRGVGDEEAQLIGFVAGYTLPLTVGFTIIGLIWAIGAAENASAPAMFIGMAIILFVTGLVASSIGLGQLPLPDGPVATSGPWYALPLALVLKAYANQYGTGLMAASLCIAVGLTLSIPKVLIELNDPTPATPHA